MRKFVAVAVTALALSSVAYLASHRSDQPKATPAPVPLSPSPESDADSAALRKMGRELSSLRGEVTALRGRIAAGTSEREEESDEAPRESHTPSQQESWREQMEEVASAFEQEPLDPSWAGRMSATLREAAAEDVALLSALRSIECRSRSCRVEIAGARDPSVQQGLTLLLGRMGTILPNVRAEPPTDKDGQITTVMYFES